MHDFPHPRRSNCLVWARRMYWRHGGYIAFRPSLYTRLIKHRLWSPDLVTWYSYNPVNPKRGWRAVLDCIWFRGEVRRGDG